MVDSPQAPRHLKVVHPHDAPPSEQEAQVAPHLALPPVGLLPEVVLVPPTGGEQLRQWEGNRLFEDPQGSWRLTGVAGSGVSTLLMDVVATKIADGIDPATIMVVAGSKDAAARLRAGIAQRVAGEKYAAPGTLVRSVHSLAFAILRTTLDAELRLITGAEQDAVMRDLLAGHAELGGEYWPEEAREAVPLTGFARGVRDFLLRASERGVTPGTLIEWGERFDRPMWQAAGKFMREYEQTMSLGGSHSLSASELVAVLLEQGVPDVGIRHLVVDDAQNLDPLSFEVIRQLAEYAEFSVVAGDPDQSVFRFRGANPRLLRDYGADKSLHMAESFRTPEVSGRVMASAGQNVEFVADTVRRWHLMEDVAWRDMAVVVRSRGMIAPVQRGLLAAGVPVHVDPTDVVLSEQRIVRAMVLAVRALHSQLTLAEVEELALGPIGGADPVTLRKLYRGVRLADLRGPRTGRRAVEVVRDLISPSVPQELDQQVRDVLGVRELDVLDRISHVLSAGAEAREASVEEALWAIWDATGLGERLRVVSIRGGAAGSQADRDLDAVMSLFDAAGDYVERRPQASVESFVDHIASQELPAGVRDRRLAAPQAVSVVTAHGTVGKEYARVVISGVQEDSWPSLQETGSLFGQEELTDFVDDSIVPGTPVSRTAARLQEEQRLFHVALTRAREVCVVTSVDAPDSEDVLEPSRFMEQVPNVEDATGELADATADSPSDAPNAPAAGVRLLSVPSIVAELRRTVAQSDSPAHVEQAARQLARLAEAGVPGAHPDQWWGTLGLSSTKPLGVAAVSPSLLENALNCPMNAALGKVQRQQEVTEAQVKGNLVHAYAEAVTCGADRTLARSVVWDAFEEFLDVPVWLMPAKAQQWEAMMNKLDSWLVAQDAMAELVGVEVGVDVTLPQGVRISGRIDRVDRTDAGYRIVDLKTSSTPVSAKAAQEHKQLAAYQLAMRYGAITTAVKDGRDEQVRITTAGPKAGERLEVDSAVLVYPAKDSKSITTREQARIPDEELDELAEQLPELLANVNGPRLKATPGDHCRLCSFITICPAREEGTMIPRLEENP